MIAVHGSPIGRGRNLPLSLETRANSLQNVELSGRIIELGHKADERRRGGIGGRILGGAGQGGRELQPQQNARKTVEEVHDQRTSILRIENCRLAIANWNTVLLQFAMINSQLKNLFN
jgi:hypothetical protein